VRGAADLVGDPLCRVPVDIENRGIGAGSAKSAHAARTDSGAAARDREEPFEHDPAPPEVNDENSMYNNHTCVRLE
jgi:hypothetical protein